MSADKRKEPPPPSEFGSQLIKRQKAEAPNNVVAITSKTGGRDGVLIQTVCKL